MRFTIGEATEIIKGFFKIFKNYGVKIPILLNGGTGLGKTSLIQQIGKELQLNVVDLKLGHLPDVINGGIPVIENGSFKVVPVEEIKRACDMPVLLFLDELTLANDFKIALSILFGGKILGYSLHPETFVISACNSGLDYDTSVLPKQVLGRFAIVNLRYSSDNYNYLIKKFEFQHLLPLSDEIVARWNDNDSNEDLMPTFCPRILEYVFWVLKGYYDKLLDGNLTANMLSCLVEQNLVQKFLSVPIETIVLEEIKRTGQSNMECNMDKLLILIEEVFEKLLFEEKVNILKFILNIEIKEDLKAGFLTKLINKITPSEKLKLPKGLIDKITKIISQFYA